MSSSGGSGTSAGKQQDEPKGTKPKGLRSRITGHGTANPRELVANPENWRQHPELQQAALLEVLENVGWVDDVIVNTQTGRLVDGHLRVKLAAKRGETEVPVKYVDLSPQEERLVLATFDPITDMATRNEERIKELLATMTSAGDAISAISTSNDTAIGKLLEQFRPHEQTRGTKLELTNVTVEQPTTEASKGEVWKLGPHVLVVADVLEEWQQWKPYLEGDVLFAPYCGPYIVLGEIAETRKLLMVQPDLYIAGHIVDRWDEHNGEDIAVRLQP